MAWDICVLKLFPRPIPLWGGAIVPIVADHYQLCLSRWENAECQVVDCFHNRKLPVVLLC